MTTLAPYYDFAHFATDIMKELRPAIIVIVLLVFTGLMNWQNTRPTDPAVVQPPLIADEAQQVVAGAFPGFGAGNWTQTGGTVACRVR